MVLVQFGLQQAFGFYAARGRTLGLVTKAVVLTTSLSLGSFVVILVLLQVLGNAFLRDISLGQFLIAFIALPLALGATFMTGIVLGRQFVRWYGGVNVISSTATTLLLILILGGLGPSVIGAIAST